MAAGESKEADYGDVLLQIVERLQQTVKGANDPNCYFSIDPDEVASVPGNHIFVVSPPSGQFREGAFVGGGANFLAAHAGCIVKIHCPSLQDQKGRDAVAITGESIGLIKKASAVLRALSPSTVGSPAERHWVPALGGFDLTSPFRPVGFSFGKDPNGAVRSIELQFAFEFDWDVSTGE